MKSTLATAGLLCAANALKVGEKSVPIDAEISKGEQEILDIMNAIRTCNKDELKTYKKILNQFSKKAKKMLKKNKDFFVAPDLFTED